MLITYVKIAFRGFRRNKLYTAINVLGLSLGLCTCIIIYLICAFELSFDNFHSGGERVYRVMGNVTENTGNKLHFGRVPFGVSIHGNELTGVEKTGAIIPFRARVAISGKDGAVKEFESGVGKSNFITTGIVQPGYFEIFKYDLLAGTKNLNEPMTSVLTESKARKYFGDVALSSLLGQKVIYDDSIVVTITGVVQDWKGNTDLGFTDFISASSLQNSLIKNRIKTDDWSARFMNTWIFIRLNASTSPETVEKQLQLLVEKHAGVDVRLNLWLEPLRNIHFNADIIENPIRTANKSMLYGLVAIALFILSLAIINFINLSTAQHIQRAKEVGVRKVLGSSQWNLMFQFLTETLLITLFAISLACLLVNPVRKAFDSFIPTDVRFQFFDVHVIVFLLVIIIITTILAGFYPARILSAYSPAISLKSLGTKNVGEKGHLRKGLIIFQFIVSFVFIIGSIVIAQQLAYTREKDPGFKSDAVIIIPTPWSDSISKIAVLKEKVKKMPSVNNVALQWLPPMTDNGRVMQLKFKTTDEKEIEVGQVAGDENFIPLYQIKLLAGRNLKPADRVEEFVINRTFLQYMGYKNPEEVLGKQLYWNDKPYPVVGVVEDFHTASFHDPITPLCVINRPDRERSLAIKFRSGQNSSTTIKETLSQVELVWKQLYPDGTFNYGFYDESLEKLYEKDEQSATLINTAMTITIFISCIGLFGLILFMTGRRAKEVSIRKVHGAGVGNILILFSKDFVRLVVIALLVASPVAWYLMNEWLNSFSYRIKISWWVFLLAGGSATLITLLTIGFHVLKTALTNPIKNLRSE